MNSQQFLSARRDRKLAVLEGFHALKHAFRFSAEVVDSISPDKTKLMTMVSKLAADEADNFETLVREVTEKEYKAASPNPPRAGVITVAKRKEYSEKVVFETNKTVVWLDNPKNHENVGAIIRLGGGLGAGAIVVNGSIDIWNPGVIRGSAGLHYALPVIKTDKQPGEFKKLVYVFDDSGETLEETSLEAASIIVFGSERHGVSEQIKHNADAIMGIPMKPGVSSLNLATSVAIGLYALRTK